MWQRDARDRTVLQPTPAAAIDVSDPLLYLFRYFLLYKQCLTGSMMVV